MNFDDSLEEPTVLPAKIPNLLINGASGIAVGMATNMLPHNLSEVPQGTKAMVDNQDITIEELMTYIKANRIFRQEVPFMDIKVFESYETGRGRGCSQGKAEIENGSGRDHHHHGDTLPSQ